MGDGVDVGTERSSELNAEMAKTSNTNNSDLLAWSGTVLLQRRVGRYTSTQHRGGNSTLELIGDRNGKVSGALVVVRVTALGVRLGLVARLALVCSAHALEAVVLEMVVAVDTVAT